MDYIDFLRLLKLNRAKAWLGERYVFHPARLIRRKVEQPPILRLVEARYG